MSTVRFQRGVKKRGFIFPVRALLPAPMAAFRIGDKVPDFSSESSAGPFNFYEYLGEVS